MITISKLADELCELLGLEETELELADEETLGFELELEVLGFELLEVEGLVEDVDTVIESDDESFAEEVETTDEPSLEADELSLEVSGLIVISHDVNNKVPKASKQIFFIIFSFSRKYCSTYTSFKKHKKYIRVILQSKKSCYRSNSDICHN